jgi:LacI family transcriptional regulator
MKKKLSIGDIAKQLHLSTTAVSFVLNGKPGVSSETKKMVLQYIEKVGYTPNRMAQGLRTGKSNTIGMMVEDISDPFFSSIARIIEESAYRHGYRIIFGSTENDTIKTIDLIQLFRNHQVDGYIIAPPPGIENEVEKLINDKLPVVFFDRTLSTIETDNILVDNFAGSYQSVLQLIKNGYKNIAMVTLSSEQNQMKDRLNAYRQAVEENGMSLLVRKITYHEDAEKSIKLIQSFLKANKEIDAIFFSTNYLAFSGIQAIKRMKLEIGKEIGILVFDDNLMFQLISPTITAIAQPIQEISDRIILTMLDRLSESETELETKNILLRTTLMERQSTSKKYITSAHFVSFTT